jgi:hypothetical protein
MDRGTFSRESNIELSGMLFVRLSKRNIHNVKAG